MNGFVIIKKKKIAKIDMPQQSIWFWCLPDE